MNKEIIFFDTETNGLDKCSVLSIAAIKIEIDLETLEIKDKKVFERYYFRNPGEEVNEAAIAVNKLTDYEIEKKRGRKQYSLFFDKDIDYFDFCSNVSHFVAHNIEFDSKFIPFELKNQFCTKKSNLNVIKKIGKNEDGKMVRGINVDKNLYKYTSLKETAEFYGIKLDDEKWHGALYDAEICKEIFLEMLKREETREIVMKFLNK